MASTFAVWGSINFPRRSAGDDSPFEGSHHRFERPLNSPAPLSRPGPGLLIGGGGERKTLRLVARYADACNLFPTPQLPRKLDVLRRHCEAEGRDFDTIERTTVTSLDVGEGGARTGRLLGQLRWLAGMGVQTVIGSVAGAERLEPLEIIGREVIPAVAEL